MKTAQCWLASFPRSGNTWVRNILYEVWGLESGTWDVDDAGKILDPDCFSFPVVKTHMLPSRLEPDSLDMKAVYLVRDGRDSMVSIAHHRSNIVAPGTDLIENMRASIHAEKGSFFGGWSNNVREWIDRADLLIRYEDLLIDPMACLERLRVMLDLPEPDPARLPAFEEMKYGLPRYGAGPGRGLSEPERRRRAERNFRRGQSGAWRDEMPSELHDLFWSIHGDTMLKLGYQYDGSLIETPDPDLDWEVERVLGKFSTPARPAPADPITVTIEAEKLFSSVNDGVKRYLVMLLKEFLHVDRNPRGRWQFRLFAGGQSIPLAEARAAIEESFCAIEKPAPQPAGKHRVSVLARVEQAMLKMVPEGLKRFLQRRGIDILHRLFDLFWSAVYASAAYPRRLWQELRHRAVRWMNSISLKRVEAFTEPGSNHHVVHLPLQHQYQPFANTGLPVVVTIHDFTDRLMPELHTPINVRNAAKGWQFAQRRGAGLIAVSQATADDAARFADGPLPPVTVIPEATDRTCFWYRVNSEDRRSVCRKYGIPDGVPFFFTLSSIEPRKNLENVIAAFCDLVGKDGEANVSLVIGGMRRWGSFDPGMIDNFCPEKVYFTGYVDDLDVPFLLSEALAFCYVSRYEGFGLPLLEALNCGTPVIYGDNSSMPEVVGAAGLPADPDDVAGISGQMERLFHDAALRERLHHSALRQAAQFSTRTMARQTLDCYLQALSR